MATFGQDVSQYFGAQQQQAQNYGYLGQMGTGIGTALQGLYEYTTSTPNITNPYQIMIERFKKKKDVCKSGCSFLHKLREEISDWHGDILRAA